MWQILKEKPLWEATGRMLSEGVIGRRTCRFPVRLHAVRMPHCELSATKHKVRLPPWSDKAAPTADPTHRLGWYILWSRQIASFRCCFSEQFLQIWFVEFLT